VAYILMLIIRFTAYSSSSSVLLHLNCFRETHNSNC